VYLPNHFKEERVEVLHQLVRSQPFATLVTLGPRGLEASHIPMVLHPQAGALGTLRGHLAKGNPQWRDASPDVQALAIFAGAHHYITPSWYPSAAEHGKAVPTWNYAVVHAHGVLRFVTDKEILLRHVRSLTEQHEAGRRPEWNVGMAPPDFIDGMLGGIVGVEMEIARLEGKWKMSQNRPPADWPGVVSGLRQDGDEDAAEIAKWIEGRISE
jgi:transcriptional regulator